VIYITQGHEKSIGLEILLKSLLTLPRTYWPWFQLVCFEQPLRRAITHFSEKFQISGNTLEIGTSQLKCHFLNDKSTIALPQSSECLKYCLDELKHHPNDILITMPTSKDQLFFAGEQVNGHTEYFRKYFEGIPLTMNFLSPKFILLLITDHIPLKDVSRVITSDIIVKRVSTSLEGHSHYFQKIEEVIFSGINPHAGEGGLIGTEEIEIAQAIKILEKKFPQIAWRGPLPGDTLHVEHIPYTKQLLVYMQHDQGLAFFKSQSLFLGANITFGMPFIRLSVDHGTAFELFEKNQANYLGILYVLKLAIELSSRSKKNLPQEE
jgi:4-hydroxythreonine-4-phosphate dehydrogenase